MTFKKNFTQKLQKAFGIFHSNKIQVKHIKNTQNVHHLSIPSFWHNIAQLMFKTFFIKK